tara:strand:- start:4493 stop:4822 length:330 start_codon:yes stop_codon:yes gene_type:complete
MNMVTLFTPNKQLKAEKARKDSVKDGKMLPRRDSTDAIRYAGRGLKTWNGTQSSLRSLGFSKVAAGVLKGTEYATDLAVGVANPKQTQGIKERLKKRFKKFMKNKKKGK